jgi:branched-chain amino acid transport system permease protein
VPQSLRAPEDRTMDVLAQLILNGIMIGSMYAIISVGLTLIFGIVRVVNFAHGEFLMIGMYAVYLLWQHLGLHPYVSALPIVVLLFVIGALTQRLIIQKLLNADEYIQIFATVGMSIALINLALLLFGADLYAVNAPELREPVPFGGFSLLTGHVAIFVCAILLVAGLHVFLNRTPLGRAIRATAQNRNAAQLMGVPVERIYIITFGLGAACVGLASALIVPLYPVTPTIGTYFVLTAFVVVVLGGMRSIYGAFFGAMIIGLVDSLSGYYIAPDLKEVVYFIIFILILIFKPTGLFGFGRGTE